MMNRLKALMRMRTEPWAITQDCLNSIIEMAEAENETPQTIAEKLADHKDGTYSVEMRGGVAIIPVHGPLFKRSSFMSWIMGSGTYQEMALDFSNAINDPAVKAIILDIDSPGGEASGVSEFADMIRAAAGEKPIISYVGGTAASAAYWIASAADEIVIDDIALLGSIGAVIGISDYREKDAKSGIKRYEIVSTQSPDKRIDIATEHGQSKMQARVDAFAQVFIEKVATFRKTDYDTISKDYGRGDMLVGQAAVDAGLADRTGSFEGLISELSKDESQYGIQNSASGGNFKMENASMYLTSNAPAAENQQQAMAATAENLSKLCPEAADALREEGRALAIIEIETLAAAEKNKAADGSESDPAEATTERERIKAIIGSESAKGREDLAQHLAFDTDMKSAQAIAMLDKAPKKESAPKQDPLSAAMQGNENPAVGADVEQGDDLDSYIARSQALGEKLGIG